MASINNSVFDTSSVFSPHSVNTGTTNASIGEVAAKHTKKFGSVSTSTGWKAVLRGEAFGRGDATGISTDTLYESIKNEYGANVASKVESQLKSIIGNETHISSYHAAKAVAILTKEVAWATAHTTNITQAPVDMDGKTSGEPIIHTVTLTPIGILKAGVTDSIAVSSKDTQNSNAVNAWVETMSSGSGVKTSFVRSGVLMPPKDKKTEATDDTEKQRMATAKTRYGQILSAIVETTPSLHKKIQGELKNNSKGTSSSNPIEIEHAHIGLLSANKEKEAGMASDQEKFISKEVNGKLFQIDYFNEDTGKKDKIWVKPKVLYTNFSVDKPGSQVANAGDVGRTTEATLDHYLGNIEGQGGSATGALADKINGLSDPNKEEASKLLKELRDLRNDSFTAKKGSYTQKGASFYSYEFQTKYSLLLEKCGIPTHVYCKSGKDRTSRFSEMLKMRAANPNINLKKMTSAVRSVIKAFSFSGNKTIQRLCTGFSGNKQFKTYWNLIAGEKKNQTFGGWTHLPSVFSYSGGGASSFVKT